MRKFITTSILLFGLGIIACSENYSPVSPGTEASTNSSEISKVNWISLPSSDDMLTVNGKPSFSTGELIDGSMGGTIKYAKSWKKGKTSYSVNARLVFSAGSFDGEKYVTLDIAPEYGHADFSPESEFYKPASYSMTIEGLNLSKINPDDIRFVYEAEDGTIEPISTANVSVDINSGTLSVSNAKLPHFSRFGFVN